MLFPGDVKPAQQQDLLLAATRGWGSVPAAKWGKIRPEAKDLVQRLLQVDPAERCSAPEALRHMWLATQSILADVSSQTTANEIAHKHLPFCS
jgi:serine/threonine/tyrosine protein kinase RAD53